ncbi:UDP-2,4-diacetamido-2,4,6-trideoxy-beta-L-altropyranose hydrolase [Ramlibacter sp.]|uniref:UDP-2,4-diacetamido-2,4, 6-trideoxy-beta-L-altropyranose hydrolase n=1 Tax=Ramlibacter sp. TaxID=1917967 RepID=UPI002D48E54F|nr:UDP-2,4-diacetamido-2,4,6-trideoxy-beta-L-altropyranose hydrolase [Ramlibacter sp.]HYD74804.1 UDP-2,4-diacetamido-2,4,6-trideoxy-beta-L-altropyranose hydrolase [Ramlibacter sp.]
MRVALRTDASGRIGTGHLRRCLSLARALNAEGVDTLFICRRHDALSAAIESEGQAHAWLPKPPPCFVARPDDPPHADWAGVAWEQDARETARALAGFAPDWVLVDHYALDARWHGALSAATSARIAAIDDLGDRPLAVDLLIDQNLQPDGSGKYEGRLPAAARTLLGPRHALLAGIYAQAPRYRFRRHVASIGIFMGGADLDDFGGRVLRACREVAGFEGSIELVSSRRSPHFAAHEELARRWPGTRVLAGLPDLADFFARHDLQVGAGGGAAWERCCLGAPTLALQIAANQGAVLPQLAARGAVEWLQRPDPGVEAIGRAVRRLLDEPRRRLALVRASRCLVDGRGSARVAAVLALAGGMPWQFRAAEATDEELLLAWANEPQARAQAFDPSTITPAGHHAWFRQRLARADDCLIVIACSRAGTPVGQVRFDRTGEAWSIDYALDSAHRGWGHGRRLLAGAIGFFRGRRGFAELKALVKADNAASLGVFRGLGFAESAAVHQGQPCREFRSSTTAMMEPR